MSTHAEPAPSPQAPFPALGQDEHVTELRANLWLRGELVDEGGQMAAHLRECERCQAYVQTLARADEAFWRAHPITFEALAAKHASASGLGAARRGPTRWRWTPRRMEPWRNLRVALAAAAVVWAALALWPQLPWSTSHQSADVEQVRLKSSGLVDFELYVHDGQRARRAQADELVQPGDRVGFKLRPSPLGHVMILGVDQSGEPYLGYPQAHDQRARPLALGQPEVTLDQALELDHTLGHERFILLVCPHPFTFEQAAARLRLALSQRPHQDILPTLWDGCAQREHTLIKKGTP